ncbi:MAG: CRISPR-associated endonuclease Cas6 [Bacteroidota bacterium]
MNTETIPILCLRLLDIPLTDNPDLRKLLLVGAKDLARKHQARFEQAGLSIDLFHNEQVIYSAIQLGRYQKAPEWTAIGEEACRALSLWYEIFRIEAAQPLRNTVEIREGYTPEFLTYSKRYKVGSLLISDELAVELNVMTNKFARQDRLEKYLYGNLQTFFTFIGFTYDKAHDFLKITVEEADIHNRSHKVYQGQKKTALKVRFTCNFRLPQHLKLGQSTSLGYGKVTHW